MSSISFDDDEDFELFVDHCRDLIRNRDNTNLAQDAEDEDLDDLDNQLKEWYEEYESGGGLPDGIEVAGFWNDLKALYTDNHPDYEWKNDKSRIRFGQGHEHSGKPIGYSLDNELLSSQLLPQKALIKHRYKRHPAPILWHLRKLEQHDGVAYFGKAKISEIDAVSSVPWLDPSMKSSDFGEKALDPAEMRNEWQRVVDQDRIQNIKSFANNPKNSLFNPIILYADESNPNIELNVRNEKANLKVEFDFLRRQGGRGFTDYIVHPTETDLRPLWIIDGQHRTRGYAISEVGYELDVPIIVIPGNGTDLARTKVAKIFTQINTEAKPIEALHQLFLRYKFKMKGPRKTNFEIVDGLPTTGTNGSRPNVRSYEMALKLASTPESPLKNTIQFQDPPKRVASKNKLITVKAWMDYATKWFRSGSIYSGENSDDFNVKEVMNFFTAFAEICNRTEWPCKGPSKWRNRKNRWENPPGESNSKPLIQQVGPFGSLLDFYPNLVDFIAHHSIIIKGESKRVPDPNVPRPISKEKFKEVLSPLKHVDWNNSTLKRKLKGRQGNVKYISIWMYTAISHGIVYDEDKVMSNSKHSKPGHGILSKPMSKDFIDRPNWFTANKLEISMKRPFHAQKSGWDVKYVKRGETAENNLAIAKRWIDDTFEKGTLNLSKEDFTEDADGAVIEKIIIKGCWVNEIGDSPNSSLTINNPR